MIVVLSPAKTLDESELEERYAKEHVSTPVGLEGAEYLVSELKKLSQAQLQAVLGVSTPLGKLNYGRFKDWGTQKLKPCIFCYDGHAFQELKGLSQEEIEFAQDHLRIISGLMGLLKPLDVIKPYRLEMGNKLVNREGKDLYAFWKAKISKWLQEELGAAPDGEQFLVNCASQEYSKAVDIKGLGFPVYEMKFPGSSMYAKAARGAMVRHILKNKVRKPEDLQTFTGKSGEWSFDPKQSSKAVFVFTRGAPKTKANDNGDDKPKAKKRKRG